MGIRKLIAYNSGLGPEIASTNEVVRFWCPGYIDRNNSGYQLSDEEKGSVEMAHYEKDIVRMELQIGQLIRIVANLNERIIGLEGKETNKQLTFIKSHQTSNKTPELS